MPIIAIADLGPVIVAVLAMILLFALSILARMIAAPLGAIPGVGGWLAGQVDGLMQDARAALSAVLHASLSAAHTVFAATLNILDQMFGAVRGALGEIAASINHLVTTSIPRLWAMTMDAVHGLQQWTAARVSAAVNWASAELGTLQRWTAARVSAAVNWASAELGTLRRWAGAEISAVTAWTAGELDTLRRWAGAEISAVTAWTAGELDTLRRWTTAQLADMVTWARQEIGVAQASAEQYAAQAAAAAETAAVTAVDTALSAGLAQAWPGIITDLEAVRSQIAAGMPDIRDAVDSIPRSVPATAAAAAAALAALAVPALRAMEDCVIPQCQDLGGVARFTRSLLSLASDAAVLAFITYAVADPAGAAADTATVGDPIAAATLGTLETVFGIRS